MGYASRSGRAHTSPSNPAAFGVCDRDGFWYNHRDLVWQYEWRGASLQNTRILVCKNCLDTPQEQLRAIVVPADPTPIINARTEWFLDDETDYLTTSEPVVLDPITGIPIPSTTTITAEDGTLLTTQPYGEPTGLIQNAVMPLNDGVTYGVPIECLSVVSNGNIVSVTTRTPHGLSTNSQISVEGLTDTRANGFYSVVVLSAMAFTYAVKPLLPYESLLGPNTLMITCLVGLPRGYVTIPLTGPDGVPPNQITRVTTDGAFRVTTGGATRVLA